MNSAIENLPERPGIAAPKPIRALFILVLGLLASWLAAGSLGWLAPPLQKALTWLALAAIVIVSLAGRRRIAPSDGLLLAGAATIALLLTAFSLPAVNIIAVAIVLAAIAQVRTGTTSQVSGSAALAATVLAVYRLACDGSAVAWVFADGTGRLEGLWAGWLTGRPLLIGASFGGVDFLVLMFALTTAWLIATPRPRARRAAWAVLFILLAQTTYLVILAFIPDVVALLPQTMPKYDDLSHLGIWTWGNAMRTLLLWNLPLVAALFQCTVAAGMFATTTWHAPPTDLPGDSEANPSAAEGKRRNRSLQDETALKGNGRRQWADVRRWGPAGLLLLAAVTLTLSPVKPDLTGRRIVAYDDGATDWSAADPGAVPPGHSPRYGLLPMLVQSLGGQFIRSRDLADAALQDADLLLVLPSRSAADAAALASIPDDVSERITRYVSAGGRLIVAGEPETSPGVRENALNALLDFTAMSFRDDTANSLTERWEDNLQSASRAATASSCPGTNHFSFDRAASIRTRWPAGPLIVGRWAWDELGSDPERPEALPYAPGNHLGDLVLAAQQNVGRGTVVVLGSASCMSNDGIPFSYTFTGPLLAALAANHSTPLAWWRQVLGLAAAGAAIVLLYRHVEPLGIAAAGLALALAMIACNLFNNARPELLPAGPKAGGPPIIYVDGSHLEAMGRDPWGENGIGRLMRVLADSNYLPLVAPDLSPDRLNQAAMLISIAPARAFSSGEIAAVNSYVEEGGFFLSTVGSPDAEPSRAMLENFELHIPPTPVPPRVQDRETTPLGHFGYPSDESGEALVKFYAGWPVSGRPGAETWSKPVIVGSLTGRGQAYLIGDSAFALNKNFDSDAPNATFWHERLKDWLGNTAAKPEIVEPEGGIIALPKPQK